MRKTAVAGLTAILTGLGAAVAALPAQAAATSAATTTGGGTAGATATAAACSTPWGTGARDKAQMVQTKVRDVRVGKHACFDRLVIDLGAGRAPGYHIAYVRAFHAQGSGKVVPTSGHAKLLVNVRAPAALSFSASSRHLVSVAGFAQFRQVAGLGSFEGITSIGLGLDTRKPFRVLEYRTASNNFVLVIDVAHR
jgi:hypothetical protein